MTPPKFVSLDPVRQRAHGWRRHGGYPFAARQSLVAVLLNELSALLPTYPLAFARLAKGSYQFVALTGLHQSANLFVGADGRWLADYVPSQLRAYPFALLPLPGETENKFALGFDQSSGQYRETPDEAAGELRFFDEHGQMQPFMRELFEFMKASLSGMRLTQRAADALAHANLLTAWTLPADPHNPEAKAHQGLYRVDEAALNALKGPALETLLQANALPLAYGQLLSMARIRRLYQLLTANQPNAAPAKAAPSPEPAATLPPELATLLGETQDSGTLNFDWLTKK